MKKTTPILQKTFETQDLFNLLTCYYLHDICDGRQFQTMRATDFADFLNLKPTTQPVIVNSRENLRVCYMIYALSLEIRDRNTAKEWRESILSTCGIGLSYYSSHYRDCAELGSGTTNKHFVADIDDAIRSGMHRR